MVYYEHVLPGSQQHRHQWLYLSPTLTHSISEYDDPRFKHGETHSSPSRPLMSPDINIPMGIDDAERAQTTDCWTMGVSLMALVATAVVFVPDCNGTLVGCCSKNFNDANAYSGPYTFTLDRTGTTKSWDCAWYQTRTEPSAHALTKFLLASAMMKAPTHKIWRGRYA